jgi:hypothetical protein
MIYYICARCGRDLRLVAHKVDEAGQRWCLSCSPSDDDLVYPHHPTSDSPTVRVCARGQGSPQQDQPEAP